MTISEVVAEQDIPDLQQEEVLNSLTHKIPPGPRILPRIISTIRFVIPFFVPRAMFGYGSANTCTTRPRQPRSLQAESQAPSLERSCPPSNV